MVTAISPIEAALLAAVRSTFPNTVNNAVTSMPTRTGTDRL